MFFLKEKCDMTFADTDKQWKGRYTLIDSAQSETITYYGMTQ